VASYLISRMRKLGITRERLVAEDSLGRWLQTAACGLGPMRFVEQWEYHEIAAARAIPIGTVQWQVFNAKKEAGALFDNSPADQAQGCLRTTGAEGAKGYILAPTRKR
jgi:hypothetical protein